MRKILIAFTLSLLLANCATLIRGSEEPVSFQSNPSGANVTLTNGQSCETPCMITIPRTAQVNAVFERSGCDDKSIYLDNTASGGAIVGGVILGGVIGIAIDYGTGAIFNVTPNPAIANMECQVASLL